MHAISRTLAATGLATLLGATGALAQGFPALAIRGIDADVRALATSSEPVAFVARCVADLTRSAQRAETIEERRKAETRAWRLMQGMSSVAAATSVPPTRAASVLALTLMPLVTSSITLMPAGGASETTDLSACQAAADDTDGYVAGLGRR